MGSFSKKEAVKFGWGVMKSHLWFFVAILILSFVAQMAPGFIGGLLTGGSSSTQSPSIASSIVSIIMSVISAAIQLLVAVGFIKIALKLHDNQPAKISDLFNNFGPFWRYLAGGILYGLIVAGGFLLLIIPGIIFATRFQYYGYLIVDQNLGPIEALKKSWAMTKGQVINLILFGLLLGLINLLGVLALVVGLFATVPTAMMAQVFVYRKLLGGGASDQTISGRRLGCLIALGAVLIVMIPIVVAAVVVAINPLELTRRSRDAVRVADLGNVNQAVGQAVSSGRPLCPAGQTICEGQSSKDDKNWVKVDLSGILATIPVDPQNSPTNFYRYCANNQGWEIEAKIESEQFGKQAKIDGGDKADTLEVGSNLTTCPPALP